MHRPVPHWYAGAQDFAAVWVLGAWDLCVRGLEPAEEARYADLLQAALASTRDEGDLDLNAWRPIVRDHVVGIRASESGGEPVRCRIAAVQLLEAHDQPTPWLPARLVTDHHLVHAVGALVSMWVGRHGLRLAARTSDRPEAPEGCEAVPTALGWLAVRPHTMQSLKTEEAQGRAMVGLLMTYLLEGREPGEADRAPPDLSAMVEDAASSVTHRWVVSAERVRRPLRPWSYRLEQVGQWVPFSMTSDPEDETADGYVGSLVVQDTVAIHEVAARHVVEAGAFLAPWTRSGRSVAEMSGTGTPPFVEDCAEYDAMPPEARLLARLGFSRAWAIERDRQTAAQLGVR